MAVRQSTIDELTTLVADRRRESTDKSNAKFFQLIREAVRGRGITHQGEAAEAFRRIKAECTRRSALHRSADAAKKKVPAQKIAS